MSYVNYYENEGEGIAFGVYFTDTMEEDLDDSTLEIGPVIDTITGQKIAEPGIYNSQPRTITWFVGEVGPKQGGFTNFSVNIRQDAQDKSEVINFATVYFPSVPEVTRTNGTVNRVTTLIDNIPPTTQATISPSPNQSGWNNTDVTVTFTATDNLSGIASVTDPITVTTEGANQYIGGEATDLADNTATTYVIINLDKTPPDITLTLNPVKLSDDDEDEEEDDETNWYELLYSAQDNLSGLNYFKAGLVIPSLDGYQIESEQDKDLDIRIDEKKKELELEAPNPQELLTQLQSGLLNLNNGQILQLKLKQGEPKWKLKEKHQGLEIQAPSIIFRAFAVDYADNTTIKDLEFKEQKRED